jgi:hypothetical protein
VQKCKTFAIDAQEDGSNDESLHLPTTNTHISLTVIVFHALTKHVDRVFSLVTGYPVWIKPQDKYH